MARFLSDSTYRRNGFAITALSDINADSYESAVIAQGGSLTAPQKTAAINFIDNLKTAGLWTDLAMLWSPAFGGSFSGANVCLKHPNTDLLVSLLNFVSGDFTIQGLLGNGTNKYMDTLVNANAVLTAAQGTYLVYNHTNTGAGAAMSAGADQIFAVNYGLDMYFDAWNSGKRISVSQANGQGFYVGTKTATNSSRVDRNKVTIGTNVVDSATAPANLNVYGWAKNVGSPSEFSSQRYSLIAVHSSGLSKAQADAFTDHYVTYAAALGRTLP